MVATKQSRTKPNSTSRLGAASSLLGPRTNMNNPLPLQIPSESGESALRESPGCATPTSLTSPDSSSFIDGRPKTAAERQREKRLRDDPLADLLGPLFVGCKRCGTRIKLSPKSSYDPFHWVKHRERCLRRSVDTVKEILRERGDQASSPDAKPAQRDGGVCDPLAAQSHHTLSSPSPSSSPSTPSPLPQRRTDTGTDSATPSLTADEDEPDKLSYPNHRGVSTGKDEEAPCEFDVPPPNASGARPPLCSLSVFRASDMLAFEDYLHRSRRLPTRLGFPELLPSPERWHDWSWGQLREPVYVVEKRSEEMQVAAGASPPPPSSQKGIGDGTLQPDAHGLPNPLGVLS
ncbi:hypothetical protein BJY52DRAFT_90531 [Lactarius psammicola]|nr:hypothetical protein BJY52DRAFT_90531 [Lactarius psammicola]